MLAKDGLSLLEIAESNGMTIESGCRMGICGADPVAIKDGMECLSGIGDDEKATLERLGYAPNTRMACCARVEGPVSRRPEARQGRGSRASARSKASPMTRAWPTSS